MKKLLESLKKHTFELDMIHKKMEDKYEELCKKLDEAEKADEDEDEKAPEPKEEPVKEEPKKKEEEKATADPRDLMTFSELKKSHGEYLYTMSQEQPEKFAEIFNKEYNLMLEDKKKKENLF
jgi:hypothetical protein